MAVAVDAVGTQNSNTFTTTVAYTGLTVGAGSDRAIGLSIVWLNDPGVVSVCRWDDGVSNQSLTEILKVVRSTGTSWTVGLYGLVAPVSGNKTLRLTWANATEYAMNTVAWTGVDQTGGTTSFPNATSVERTAQSTGSLSITLPTNGAGMSAVSSGDSVGLGSTSATQLYLHSGNGPYEGGGSYSTSSGTFSGTTSGGTDNWLIAAMGIAPVSGGGGGGSTFPGWYSSRGGWW